MRTRTLASVLITCVSLVGCGGNDSPPTGTEADALAGTVWQLAQVETSGDVAFDVEDPENFSVRFLPGSAVVIKDGCNECTGTYAYAPNVGFGVLEFSVTCTELTCIPPPSLSAYSQWLLSAHEGGVHLGKLRVVTETPRLWLVHEPVVD